MIWYGEGVLLILIFVATYMWGTRKGEPLYYWRTYETIKKHEQLSTHMKRSSHRLSAQCGLLCAVQATRGTDPLRSAELVQGLYRVGCQGHCPCFAFV
jgi:hypothetical protein